jgi:metallo-beta-lactamase family protein
LNLIPLGGAGTVTGSKFLLQSGRTRVLIDCGLFQGLKNLRLRNRAPFPIAPSRIQAVVLTHAHLDHSGYLPVFVREGFEGPIYVTAPTRDLLPILLADAGRLQEEDASFAARRGFSKHADPRPLFTERDAAAVIPQLQRVPLGDPFTVGGLSFSFHRAGHLLGAASVRAADRSGTSILFSGDLGRPDDVLMHPPEAPRPAADLVLMESTYGNRDHGDADPMEVVAQAVRMTASKGGVLMVPTFAVGRAQMLALVLHRLRREGRIPAVPMFLNSPMANRASEVYQNHAQELRPDPAELEAALLEVEPVGSVDASRALNHRRGPMVILAGAGMLTGGRILHHLEAFGGDPRNTLLMAGYQAEGTRGRDLSEGRNSIRVHGHTLDLRCQILRVDAFSGHADRTELKDWLRSGPEPSLGVRLVHGEPGPADALRRDIRVELGWRAEVAEEGRPIDLDPPHREASTGT